MKPSRRSFLKISIRSRGAADSESTDFGGAPPLAGKLFSVTEIVSGN